ncbi:MAG: TlpA disulfide reductase family protein [Planctomycetota bacterium]|nr:TlpA disulfide reductase family protein [Planctomycetota bacterium]
MSWMKSRSVVVGRSRKFVRRLFITGLPLVGIVVMSFVVSGKSSPPHDDEIKQISSKYKAFAKANAQSEGFKQREAAYCASLIEGYDLAELSVSHLRGLFPVLLKCPDRHEALHERLTELASNVSTDGFVASSLDYFLASAQGQSVEMNLALRQALAHDAMPTALEEGSEIAGGLLDTFSTLDSRQLTGMGEVLIAFGQSLPDQIPGSILPSTLNYYLALLRVPDGEVEVAASEPIRQHLVTLFTKATKVAEDAKRSDAWYLKSRIAMLNGAFARRALMNQEAPPMEILWSSNSALVPTLENLRGKVIVLDYWAIWCAPCIAKFPEMRELQTRYGGFDVEIIGMTSPQGYHLDPEKGRIDCSNDHEKEFNLVSGYMSHMDMTWTVAYSRESLFNNDYGVVSLPHMAILDTQGRVRFNNIPVTTSLEELGAMIDSLLEEANLRAPE